MNIEFHYYALYYLASQAGYSPGQASIIAVSSQLADECTSPWEIRDGSGNPAGRTETTQNYVFWNENVARDVYKPFHFIPGDSGLASSCRADGKANPATVTPDSPLARSLLVSALKSGDPYRAGIALHSYADTWAHQNFSGDSEPGNALDSESPFPPAGHLQAFGAPDDPRRMWTDRRLLPEHAEISNSERFRKAAIMIFRFLRTSLRRDFRDASLVVDPLSEIWRGPEVTDAAARASDYIVSLGVPPYEPEAWPGEAGGVLQGRFAAPSNPFGREASPSLAGYDPVAWLRSAALKSRALLGTPRGFIPLDTYRGSRFERWNAAAAAHRSAYHTLMARGTE